MVLVNRCSLCKEGESINHLLIYSPVQGAFGYTHGSRHDGC
uniref:Uncharacterized protein n=1 Tax=Nelumbo nucifera TaxID=4432 RepID=A0A822Z7F9_NELNU|nr:TPA_asm: hypothetical protein HUJ06_013662 [Nelumbo nucifera]